ncbi:Sodium/bile acid symporter family [hydrothermal vent metagenome]|uniref:Sodium/bile acid symporter family n=1 Tax=hydrothermal vent metagenome TaxID=652676 RepID=A0A3B0U269_9ZZZZ
MLFLTSTLILGLAGGRVLLLPENSRPSKKHFDNLTDTLVDSVHINFDDQTLWVLNVVLTLVMFGVALEISVVDFKQLLKKPKPIFIGVISQFILLPLITYLLVLITAPLPSIALGMFMVAACPGGNISNFIAHLAKGNTALSVSLTAVATLFAVFLTPLNLQLWGSLYAPTAVILKEVAISPLEMMKLVMLLLGIPLVLGMWVNHLRPRFAKKMAKVLKVVSLMFFVSLIFVAFYNNSAIFIDYIFYVFWIVVLHNLVAFSTGFSFAKLMGLSRQNIRTITIETGIQNSGLGLLLIFTFFDGLGGMALLAAFWGIWHLISGLFLAGFWGYKPLKKETLV